MSLFCTILVHLPLMTSLVHNIYDEWHKSTSSNLVPIKKLNKYVFSFFLHVTCVNIKKAFSQKNLVVVVYKKLKVYNNS